MHGVNLKQRERVMPTTWFVCVDKHNCRFFYILYNEDYECLKRYNDKRSSISFC